MKIYLSEGSATVEWNDYGDPMTINVLGVMISAADHDLRNLYACLDYLFSKPHGPGSDQHL